MYSLLKDVMPDVLKSMQNPETQKRTTLITKWPEIVGEKIAGRTKPVLTNQGCLWVWVDQSTLAFELNQKFKNSILKRTQALLGEENINKVCIRVGQIR